MTTHFCVVIWGRYLCPDLLLSCIKKCTEKSEADLRFLPSCSKRAVPATVRNQFCMRAIFGNLSICNHGNVVGALHSRQSMRHNDDGSSSH